MIDLDKGFLAIDLGASGGKAVLGKIKKNKLEFIEVHRFENIPLELKNNIFWDFNNLYRNVIISLRKAGELENVHVESVGIDSWGVDFGLVNIDGFLLCNPFHYRNAFNYDFMERVFEILPKEEIFKRCPTQFQPFNSLYQLYGLKRINRSAYEITGNVLSIPSLFYYFLTGKTFYEYTFATTTQMYNYEEKNWDDYLLDKLSLRNDFLPEILPPGTNLGKPLKAIKNEIGCEPDFICVPTHDTGSAVSAIPMDYRDTMFISSGTWCLTGIVTEKPVRKTEVMKYNLANEGMWEEKNRLLANSTGMWLIQKLLKEWNSKNSDFDFSVLTEMAGKSKGFKSFIDVNNKKFMKPSSMENAIKEYIDTDLSRGEIVRLCLEGLAFDSRKTRELLEDLTDRKMNKIHIVGGGIKNDIFCQMVANANDKLVQTGPAESTAMGNIITQMISGGYLKDLNEAHDLIKNSIEIKTYTPEDAYLWNDFYSIKSMEGTR